jgi:hypothetical protein
VSPVKYELGFYMPADDILHSHRRENLKSLYRPDFTITFCLREIIIIIIIIIIINFKLRVGFHPVAVALPINTQIKHITYRIQITYTPNTQNIHIKYKYHTKYNTEMSVDVLCS